MEGNKDISTEEVLERVRDFCTFGKRDNFVHSYIIKNDNPKRNELAKIETYIALFGEIASVKYSNLIFISKQKDQYTIEGRRKICSKIKHLELPDELSGINGTLSKDERIAQGIASFLRGWPRAVLAIGRTHNEGNYQNQEDKEIITLYTLNSIPPEEALNAFKNIVIEHLARQN